MDKDKSKREQKRQETIDRLNQYGLAGAFASKVTVLKKETTSYQNSPSLA